MMELNEKLATWAGFNPINQRKTPSGGVYWSYVTYPDGTKHGNLPDFTESLDACFKWLVPEDAHIEISEVPENTRVRLTPKGGETTYEGYCSKQQEEDRVKRLATALCRAIEQLIDKEAT